MKKTIIQVSMNRKPYNISEVIKNTYGCLEICEIVKVKYVDNKEWDKITSDFYQPNTIYENIGGWGGGGYVQVLQIINEKTNENIFVNTEGYDYARYVGVV